MPAFKKYNSQTQQWESLLSGPQGAQGYTGSTGNPGGYTGSIGALGYSGSVGPIGYTGSVGFVGSIGSTGYTGSAGPVDFVTAQTLSNKTLSDVDTSSTIKDSSGTNSYVIGYRNVPQNVQSTTYTLVNSDEGKHIYYTGGTANITIPTDGNTTGGNFAVGAAISIINHGSGNVTVLHSGNLFFAGNTTAGSRVISAKGIATVIKVAANVWYISGGGVT